jgi:hypothetical protein
MTRMLNRFARNILARLISEESVGQQNPFGPVGFRSCWSIVQGGRCYGIAEKDSPLFAISPLFIST